MNVPKGERGINYKAVQNWTRKVDLFSYDYVVVPINEAAHWYVAVICNLQGLLPSHQKEPESSPPEDGSGEAGSRVIAVRDTPQPEETTGQDQSSLSDKAEANRKSFASMNLSDEPVSVGEEEKAATAVNGELSEDDDKPLISFVRTTRNAMHRANSGDQGSSMKMQGQQQRGKKKKGASDWVDPSRPTIITFDSLDLSRQPTIKTLKQYLYEEAKSKRDIEIDTSLIRGIKARGIPLQRNYTDCGLYLLAYVEKFVQNPDCLIGKLLQRETATSVRWPVLQSDLLRRRLRTFLDDLYDEQQRVGHGERGDDRDTLADRKQICFLLGPKETDDDQEGDDCSGKKRSNVRKIDDDNDDAVDVQENGGK